MRELHFIPQLPKIAASESTILITGPTGTGKSCLAEKIHLASRRRAGKFVAINLATLNENLIESELFGHERGAFSGANMRRIGKLETAAGGTVFLDEIGELSPAMQTRLLEVLNSKVISPVGSNRLVRLDVRIVAATNRDLAGMVESGEFRADLFFRVNTFQVELPALACDPEAIPGRARDFLRQLAAPGSELPALGESFVAKIKEYPWPGNLRELKNAVVYAHTVAASPVELQAEDLPPYILQTDRSGANGDQHAGGSSFPINFHEAKDAFERAYIEAMLARFGGKINLTSRQTRLSKVTLIDKIRKFGIDVGALRVAAFEKSREPDLVRYL